MPDDDYELPEEGDEDQEQRPAESSVIKGFRKREKDLTRQLKEYETRVAELTPIKEEFEATKLRNVFASLELPEKYADLYRKVNPQGEVTPEAVKAFAEEYSLPGGSPAPAPAPAPTAPAGGFAPPVPTVPTSPIITREQLEQVYKLQGPDKAAQYIKEGRVQWHNLPS
jgi:hypothetical protein